jgi:hypothetical protein
MIVLSTQAVLKVAFLPSCHLGCSATWPCDLVIVKKALLEHAVIVNYSLFLLWTTSLNLLVLTLATADMSPYKILWASGQKIRVELTFPTRHVMKPPSSLTLFPLVSRLAIKITCDNRNLKQTMTTYLPLIISLQLIQYCLTCAAKTVLNNEWVSQVSCSKVCHKWHTSTKHYL